eukprot:792700-Prorocentrum_minimum.AAC.2
MHIVPPPPPFPVFAAALLSSFTGTSGEPPSASLSSVFSTSTTRGVSNFNGETGSAVSVSMLATSTAREANLVGRGVGADLWRRLANMLSTCVVQGVSSVSG